MTDRDWEDAAENVVLTMRERRIPLRMALTWLEGAGLAPVREDPRLAASAHVIAGWPGVE